MHLPRPAAGNVQLDSTGLTTLAPGELREARRRIQLISQDPVSALNQRHRIREIVAEGLAIAGTPRSVATRLVGEVLERVGMDIDIVGDRRPHQLSGGQCQWVAIARALVLQLELIICDEPVASLGVSVQGQVLNLLADMLADMLAEFGLAQLFISHDLSVVHKVSDRIAVMYLGQIVEPGPSDVITRSPAHRYTRALLEAVPVPDPSVPIGTSSLVGEIPPPMSPPSGCRFRTRCPVAQEICTVEPPQLRDVGGEQQVACHFPLSPDVRGVGALAASGGTS